MRGKALAYEPQVRSSRAVRENAGMADEFKRCCNEHQNSESLVYSWMHSHSIAAFITVNTNQENANCLDFEESYVRHPMETSRCSNGFIVRQRGGIRFGILITPIIPNITLIKLPFLKPRSIKA